MHRLKGVLCEPQVRSRSRFSLIVVFSMSLLHREPKATLNISLPLVGVPASLGPGLRTVRGAKRRHAGALRHDLQLDYDGLRPDSVPLRPIFRNVGPGIGALNRVRPASRPTSVACIREPGRPIGPPRTTGRFGQMIPSVVFRECRGCNEPGDDRPVGSSRKSARTEARPPEVSLNGARMWEPLADFHTTPEISVTSDCQSSACVEFTHHSTSVIASRMPCPEGSLELTSLRTKSSYLDTITPFVCADHTNSALNHTVVS
jgi:hypothetical protein